MGIYAQRTEVPVERSQREIEDLVTRHGASGFIRGQYQGRAIVAFQMKDRRIQFEIPLPTENDFKHRHSKAALELAIAQRAREKWRALALAIKAKLVGVEAGVETFEEAFLAHIVIPGGGRYANVALMQIAEAYKTGKLPPLLGAGTEK